MPSHQRSIFKLFFTPALFVLGLALVSGCGDDDPVVLFKTTLTLKNGAGDDKTSFTLGEPITFVLSITNPTKNPQIITLPSSQLYDFQVFETKNITETWRWSYGTGALPVVIDLIFDPMEMKLFSVEWNQTDNAGTPIPKGSYLAQGFMATFENINDGASPLPIVLETRSSLVGLTIQ